MPSRSSLRYWGPAAALLLLAACNLPGFEEATPTSTLTLEEIEELVGEALIAEGAMTEAARPSDTPRPPEPSPTATDSPVTPTEVPTEAPSCLVVAIALNLRSGPGLPYDPPLQTLTSGTVLLPFAKNADGSWLEVQLQGESTTGWVSAGGQFVSCNFDPSGLPLGQIPPTPTPTDTLTPGPTSTQGPTSTSTSTDTPKPPTPTNTPTSVPPTDTPTSTPCPKFTNGSLDASVDDKANAVNLIWDSQGGCTPITGTITAKYNDEKDPYKTYPVEGNSGKLTDFPECREGTFSITYTLTLSDSSGQSMTANDSVEVTRIC